MTNSTIKIVAYAGAVVLAADLMHLKAEPHAHQEREDGPPIHARIARQTANYVTSDLQMVRFDEPIDVAGKMPMNWYLLHAASVLSDKFVS